MTDEEDHHEIEAFRFRDVDFADPHLLKVRPRKRRKSTVVCTIGNENITDVEIQQMMESGMNVAKFKISHLNQGEKARILAKVAQAARGCCEIYGIPNWPIATCFELKTCNTRTGHLKQTIEFIEISEGTEVIITNDVKRSKQCCAKEIFIDSMFLKENAKVGNEISIAEDNVILQITELIDDNSIKCVTIHGGNLGSNEQVSMRCVDYAEPLLSERDYEILKLSIEHQIDMVIINYVRCAETIKLAKTFMKNVYRRPVFFAGICTNQCLSNIDSILREADGIILSRHILAYELAREEIFFMSRIQKWLTAKCLKAGKSLYIAGGVFGETVTNGIIYDTEIFDFTNALFDGVTGFVLNECYDSDFAINTLKIMNEICGVIEPLTTTKSAFWTKLAEIQAPVNAAKATAIACIAIANQSFSRAIIIPTVSGITAKFLLNLYPSCFVYTVSTSGRVSRKLASFRCVVPLVYKESKFNKTWDQIVKERVKYAMEYAVKKGFLVYGDHYVTLQRGKDSSAYCDTVQLWQVSIFRRTTIEMFNGYMYPALPYFSSRIARVNTFVDWPNDKRQKPEQLADAGFFYTGVEDRTMCFYCRGGLKDWNKNDDPWQEHIRCFSQCPYIKIVC